jgi:hypothetical protein
VLPQPTTLTAYQARQFAAAIISTFRYAKLTGNPVGLIIRR